MSVILMDISFSKWKANEKSVRRLALSHDETKLAIAGHAISLWNVDERKSFKVCIDEYDNRRTRANAMHNRNSLVMLVLSRISNSPKMMIF